MSLAKLYREVILAHAAKPVGHGVHIDATHSAEGHNPLCGDRITVHLAIADRNIAAAAFDGEACAICLASASLLCAQLPGRPVSAAAETLAAFSAALDRNDAGDGIGNESAACPDFMVPMLGVRAYPARMACATLPWEAATQALDS